MIMEEHVEGKKLYHFIKTEETLTIIKDGVDVDSELKDVQIPNKIAEKLKVFMNEQY